MVNFSGILRGPLQVRERHPQGVPKWHAEAILAGIRKRTRKTTNTSPPKAPRRGPPKVGPRGPQKAAPRTTECFSKRLQKVTEKSPRLHLRKHPPGAGRGAQKASIEATGVHDLGRTCRLPRNVTRRKTRGPLRAPQIKTLRKTGGPLNWDAGKNRWPLRCPLNKPVAP